MAFEIIGHRGSSFDAPENTIAAAKLAWEEKADGIEIDIRMTADERIVVIHDETTIRTSNKKIYISKSTIDQVKKIDVGSYKGTRWENEKIPTLEEMLEVTPVGKKLIVEFKCLPNAIEKLSSVIKSSNRMEDVALACFDLQNLKAIRKSMPDVAIFWVQDVAELDSYLRDWIIEKSTLEKFNGFMLNESAIDEDLIQLVKGANMKLYAWTVNSPTYARRFSGWGINGVITDRPGWLKERLKQTIAM